METKETEGPLEEPIPIDYDNIDVADIMARIKKRITLRPPSPEEEPAAGSGPDGDGIPELPVPPEPPDLETKGRVKRILLKIMRPFTPLIKFLILPVNEELVRTVKFLDYTGRRQAYLADKFSWDLRMLARDLNRRADHLEGRIRELERMFAMAKDNTKLLHNLSHNLVVELTKLKIEYEALKGKARIMEKDLEMLEKREKAIEKKVLE